MSHSEITHDIRRAIHIGARLLPSRSCSDRVALAAHRKHACTPHANQHNLPMMRHDDLIGPIEHSVAPTLNAEGSRQGIHMCPLLWLCHLPWMNVFWCTAAASASAALGRQPQVTPVSCVASSGHLRGTNLSGQPWLTSVAARPPRHSERAP